MKSQEKPARTVPEVFTQFGGLNKEIIDQISDEDKKVLIREYWVSIAVFYLIGAGGYFFFRFHEASWYLSLALAVVCTAIFTYLNWQYIRLCLILASPVRYLLIPMLIAMTSIFATAVTSLTMGFFADTIEAKRSLEIQDDTLRIIADYDAKFVATRTEIEEGQSLYRNLSDVRKQMASLMERKASILDSIQLIDDAYSNELLLQRGQTSIQQMQLNGALKRKDSLLLRFVSVNDRISVLQTMDTKLARQQETLETKIRVLQSDKFQNKKNPLGATGAVAKSDNTAQFPVDNDPVKQLTDSLNFVKAFRTKNQRSLDSLNGRYEQLQYAVMSADDIVNKYRTTPKTGRTKELAFQKRELEEALANTTLLINSVSATMDNLEKASSENVDNIASDDRLVNLLLEKHQAIEDAVNKPLSPNMRLNLLLNSDAGNGAFSIVVALSAAYIVFLFLSFIREREYRIINIKLKAERDKNLTKYTQFVVEKESIDKGFQESNPTLNNVNIQEENLDYRNPENSYTRAQKIYLIFSENKKYGKEDLDLLRNALEYIENAINLAVELNRHTHPPSKYFGLKADILKEMKNLPEYDAAISKFNEFRKEEKVQENISRGISIDRIVLSEVPFFGSLTWSFQPGINILLGKNGYGKSHLLGLLITMLYEENRYITRWIKLSDNKTTVSLYLKTSDRVDEQQLKEKEKQLSEALGNLMKKEMESEVSPDEIDRLKNAVHKLQRDLLIFKNVTVADNKGIDLNGLIGKVPILAIPDSRFIDKRKLSISDADSSNESMVSSGAKGFLDLSGFTDSINSFLLGLARNFKSPEDFKQEPYLLMKGAIQTLSGNNFEWKDIRFDAKGYQFLVQTEGSGDILPLQYVSQGTFSVLAMLGTIYSFLKEMYPSSGRITEERAIVIIDEVDAHLHPSWHQKIISLLRRSFPAVQFVITAHSPLVISGCRANEVSVLKKQKGSFTIESIKENLIGVSPDQLLRLVFDVEGKDETFLMFEALVPLKQTFIEQLNMKQQRRKEFEGVAGKEKDFMLIDAQVRELEERLYYITEVETIKNARKATDTNPVV